MKQIYELPDFHCFFFSLKKVEKANKKWTARQSTRKKKQTAGKGKNGRKWIKCKTETKKTKIEDNTKKDNTEKKDEARQRKTEKGQREYAKTWDQVDWPRKKDVIL